MTNSSAKPDIFVNSDSNTIEGFSMLIDGEIRYIVMDSETGEIYDNAHGYGYQTAEEAIIIYNQRRGWRAS